MAPAPEAADVTIQTDQSVWPASAVSDQRLQKLRPLDEADDLAHPPIWESEPGQGGAAVRCVLLHRHLPNANLGSTRGMTHLVPGDQAACVNNPSGHSLLQKRPAFSSKRVTASGPNRCIDTKT